MANKVLVINVLSKEYYEDCRIQGSVHVPLEELPEYAMNLEKDQKIVVYCANYACPTSRKAWHMLHDMDFKHAWAYEGGMAEWHQKGYPTEGACQQKYLTQTYEVPEAEGRVRKISAEDLHKLIEASK